MAATNETNDTRSIYFNALGKTPSHLRHKKASEARREARDRSGRILANYAELAAIVSRHEAVVQKRWTKKTKEQRLKVLLTAWPGMAPSHRPDFYALRRDPGAQPDTRTRLRAHFLLPYINQEDLLQPKNLLLMLNARGRHHPSRFALKDSDAMRIAKVTYAILPVLVVSHVMILNDVEGDQEYGELRSFKDPKEAYDWSRSHNQYFPGEGLLILEAQERIMEFLLICAKDILRDFSPTDLTGDKYPVQPEPVIKPELESRGFTSLASMVMESQYRLSTNFNLEGITSVLDAALSDAKDHLLGLREDPAYFEEQVFEEREHCLENVKDPSGQVHHLIKEGFHDMDYLLVVPNLLYEAFFRVEMFFELHRQAQELQLWRSKLAPIIRPTAELPREFVVALMKFNHYTRQSLKHMLNNFKLNVGASPPLRKFYVRDPSASSRSSAAVELKPHINPTKIESQLLWLVRIISENSEELSEISHPLILDELERLVESEPEAWELISSRVAESMGVLSILTESIAMIQFNPNMPEMFEELPQEESTKIMEGFSVWTAPVIQTWDAISPQTIGPMYQLADPAGGRFHYPIEKRRTKDNVALLRKAEQNLDEFWSVVDPPLEGITGKAMEHYLSFRDSVQRTPEWVEEPSVASEKPEAAPDVTGIENLSLGSIDNLGAHSSSAPEAKLSVESKRTKVKTRGVAQEAPSASPEVDVERPAEQKTVPLPSRALKVFRTIFFNPEMNTTPGEISWTDFLHAMSAMGFSAEKRYGSAWQFKNEADAEQSTILFHEPHPSNKIRIQLARRYGRRLTRRFGWHGSTFVPKK